MKEAITEAIKYDGFKIFFGICGVLSLILFLLIILVTIIGSAGNRYTVYDTCDAPLTRIGYVLLPAKKLGCWLGEVPNDPRNEKKPNIIRHTRD